MKKFLLSFILIMLTCIIVHAQDRQAITKVMEISRKAWNRGDLETFMQSYWKSDSVMFVGQKGPTYGYQNMLNRYKSSYPNKAAMGILTYKLIKLEILDAKNAFLFGAWHLKRQKDAPGGYYTLWFKKIDGKWVIVCDHTS